VIAMASPSNFELLQRLGAARVFDRSSTTVIADIAAAATDVAGVFAVGTGSAEPAVAVAIATGAKRVSLASPSVKLASLPRRPGFSRALVGIGLGMVTGNVALQINARAHGIRAKYVWGSTLMDNEVGPMLFEHFLPAALAAGAYIAAPPPEVVGTGLEGIQVALDRLRVGVSARKLVVTL
jgi:hypothetical protein